jgi:predicted ester cyclase
MEIAEAPAISGTAWKFFDACETGRGWEGCRAFCHESASFASQAEPLAEISTLEGYADWMKGLLGPIPDGRYELKAWATDEDRNAVMAFAVFHGTHSGEGGPVAPTGNKVAADYVYVMEFDGDRIRHVTKIWNAPWSLRELGWA